MTDISIVMPCHNRAHDLLRVLKAYEAQSGDARFELIAVDDASKDATYQVLSSFDAHRFELRAVRQDRNTGPSGARNTGIALAKSPLIAFVGDDILPASDFVQRHVTLHSLNADPRVTILGKVSWAHDLPTNSLMRHIDGPGAQQFAYMHMRDGGVYDYRHLYTANVSLKTDFLRAETPWFDLDFHGCGYPCFEDAELGYRLTKRGMRIVYSVLPRAEHYHYITIWSFSARQRCSGRMACIMLRKHPLSVSKLLTTGMIKALMRRYSQRRPLTSSQVQDIELTALHMASECEWKGRDLADPLYRAILDYQYFAGLAEGLLPDVASASRVCAYEVERSLLPAMQRFAYRNGLALNY